MHPGCGLRNRRFLRAASIRWPQARLLGVDPAEQMVLEAARLNPQATFKVGFAESLPFSDESADIIVSSLSFHHWENHQKGIQEMARVLRPTGLLCLADHNMLLAKLWREKVKSRKEIQTFMVEAGLSVRRRQGMGLRFVLITWLKNKLRIQLTRYRKMMPKVILIQGVRSGQHKQIIILRLLRIHN